MNKFRGIIALLMGINSGMQITSSIWSPSPEKIPMAILWAAISVIYILQIKEPPKKEKKDEVISVEPSDR